MQEPKAPKVYELWVIMQIVPSGMDKYCFRSCPGITFDIETSRTWERRCSLFTQIKDSNSRQGASTVTSKTIVEAHAAIAYSEPLQDI